MMKVQTVSLGILCWTWCWIPIILAKQCQKTFQPRGREHIQFSFPKAHEDFFNFQAIKVQFAKRAKHLLLCPEEEPLRLVLRYRKVGTKKWPNSINIDLDSNEVIIEEGIESCSTYQFQLRGSAGTANFRNTRVGKFDTGPKQLMRSSIETIVDQNWVGFDWANYTDNCSEGIFFEHQKKTALAPHGQHNVSLVECKKNDILLAPKFNEQRGIPVKFEFSILPLQVNISPIIDDLGLNWDLSHLNCPEILKVDLKFYLSYLNTDTFHIIFDKTVKFFAFGSSHLSRQDIKEDGVRQGIIAPCQQQSLTFNLTMHGHSNNSREVNIVQGIPIMVDANGNLTFTPDLDPECLVVKTNARGSKAWDQENDHLDSPTDGYDLVEEILKRNTGSPIQPSTARPQGEVETTLHSVDPPNISQDTPSTTIEVLDVTITESSSTSGPEDIDYNVDEEVDDVQEEEFQYDYTSPDPILPTYNGSVDEDIHLVFHDDNVTDSNGTDQSDDKEKGQLYDSYDHYGPALLEEFDQPVTTTEMSQTNVFTANLARTGNMNESIPKVVHPSSGPLWLILLLVFLGMIAVLAAVFFGTAAYIRIRKDTSEMTPEWESPTVKEPLQLNTNSNQEDITFTNENYKTNPKNDVEHETNF